MPEYPENAVPTASAADAGDSLLPGGEKSNGTWSGPEDLLRAYQELQEQYQRCAQALATAAHDLRTPLAVMSGASSSLAESGERLSAAERTALAQSIYAQARAPGGTVHGRHPSRDRGRLSQSFFDQDHQVLAARDAVGRVESHLQMLDDALEPSSLLGWFLEYGGQNLRKAAAYTYQAILALASTTLGVDKSQLTVKDGVFSLWNGQRAFHVRPAFFRSGAYARTVSTISRRAFTSSIVLI